MAKFFDSVGCLVGILLMVSLPLSFVSAIVTDYRISSCDTYAYYLPATFLFCNLTKERK